MKLQRQLYAIIILALPALAEAQNLTASGFFKSDTVSCTYLGIDFTQAKLINDEASNPQVIQERQFQGINFLMIKESKKYDLQEAYRRKTWNPDIKEVDIRNQKVDPDSLGSKNDADLYRLGEENIDRLVGDFNFGSKKGYGILLIVEGMSKSKKIMTVWFTLIDMNTKKVLQTDMLEGKVGSGFGFRNYWATALKNAINQVKNKKYEEWAEMPSRTAFH